MNTQAIENDIHVLYVTADSFPDGILSAYERLHTHIPFSPERKFYGLSRIENGRGIVYKAAVEMKDPSEPKRFDLETMTIARGKYLTETVLNFKDDIPKIGMTFEKLLRHPDLDPEGYCVEWYLPNDKDVVCMVRLKQ
jgi:hypothetical protein